MKRCYVTAEVCSVAPGGPSWTVEIGEFEKVYDWARGGISIGSDPRCMLVLDLPEVPPLAGCVIAASNHRLFYRLEPGATLPLPQVTIPLGEYESRDREFRIGPFLVGISDIYRDD